MAVDSRDKGKRGEAQVRDLLRERTGLQWERVPGSGAYGANHGLKGDVYLPPATGHMSKICVEVKWYKDEQVTSNMLNTGVSQVEKWWEQTVRESEQMNMRPALIFKKDRGNWLIALSFDDPAAIYLAEYQHFTFSKRGTEIIIGDFKTWLNKVPVEEIIK